MLQAILGFGLLPAKLESQVLLNQAAEVFHAKTISAYGAIQNPG